MKYRTIGLDGTKIFRVPRLLRDNAKDKDCTRLPRLQKPAKSNGSQSSGGALPKQPIASLDPHRLAQRQKQVDYGKNTIGYQRYLQQVPKEKRRRKGEQWLDPVTPDINQNISKRCFDGQFAERTRLQKERDDAAIEDITAVSAIPSSPTNSSRSRGSLDGYVDPHIADGGRKRCFQRAFDHAANGNPHPSKLITSPAGPKPIAPQSAPPATAADALPGPSPAGLRCINPPTRPGSLAGLPRGSAAVLPKAPQTAPPVAAARITAGSTADAPDGHEASRSELGAAAAGDDLFRDWEDEDYAGLEACRAQCGRHVVMTWLCSLVTKVYLRECVAERFLLTAAAGAGDTLVVRTLLRAGVNAGSCGGRALVAASAAGHVAVMEVLLRAGVSARAENGMPLRAACHEGRVAAARLLLHHGADPRAAASGALAEAARGGHLELVLELLAAGADPRVDGSRALVEASAAGHGCVVLALLVAGAQPHARNGLALRQAEAGGHREVLEVLHAAASRHGVGSARATPLLHTLGAACTPA
ncbi:hypothetical protein VOLCADRAFT_106146 [Volvox carteri f. nagariensis]|uniref:Histone RNA hairpin-binding protein RNA-binding domain-containing protein n=1 Tax=Volvox carteri f. nagariensis TaxID=3068 RepID=D8U5D6_VOLCA|nr:uncharacterized protein VOLCADRAFT_106146 [Volvox carteri f. nagariensis]EFJ45197.1 hypothetical protein VOLCADRAFT_106146 [Volvox carteri f. nagariensis]|eukprot:XP_002953873.1 hypothetical protein VOLCADRAFT_106146 [Volvox carteri f. nagariensis]